MSKLSHILVIILLVALLIAMVTLLIRQRIRPAVRRFNRAKFQADWQEIQRLCKTTETWPLAVINADKLLDQALKQCRTKGKTMGERLVASQRSFSDNDSVWFGHKLRNRIVHEEMAKLRQQDVQGALRGFRQALKDLGALA